MRWLVLGAGEATAELTESGTFDASAENIVEFAAHGFIAEHSVAEDCVTEECIIDDGLPWFVNTEMQTDSLQTEVENTSCHRDISNVQFFYTCRPTVSLFWNPQSARNVHSLFQESNRIISVFCNLGAHPYKVSMRILMTVLFQSFSLHPF